MPNPVFISYLMTAATPVSVSLYANGNTTFVCHLETWLSLLVLSLGGG